MKKISLFFVVLFTASLLITTSSCNKKYQPSLSCKIDGVDYNSNFRINNRGGFSDFDGKEVLLIAATDNALSINDGKYLTLFIAGAELKTYELTPSIFEAKAGCTVVWSPKGESSAGDTTTVGAKYTGFTGSVTITKMDEDEKRMSGTFNFIMKDPKNLSDEVVITEGEFTDIKYSNKSISMSMLSAFVQ